jgi:hypothetical protein
MPQITLGAETPQDIDIGSLYINIVEQVFIAEKEERFIDLDILCKVMAQGDTYNPGNSKARLIRSCLVNLIKQKYIIVSSKGFGWARGLEQYIPPESLGLTPKGRRWLKRANPPQPSPAACTTVRKLDYIELREKGYSHAKSIDLIRSYAAETPEAV